jgi:hypothetical protein
LRYYWTGSFISPVYHVVKGYYMSVILSPTTPAAPAGNTNVIWQSDGQGNISGYVPTSGSGGGNYLQVEVDFGFSAGNEGDIARVTVTGQSWVTAGSVILCNPFGGATADHSPDDAIVEGLVAYAENVVAGVGFDVVVYAPQNSWGKYLVNVTGK